MPRLACASCAPLGGGYRPDPLRLVKPSPRLTDSTLRVRGLLPEARISIEDAGRFFARVFAPAFKTRGVFARGITTVVLQEAAVPGRYQQVATTVSTQSHD